MSDDPIDVALRVCSKFDDLGIPYYIAGSVASTVYGRIRTTHDIDLVADVKPEHVDSIVLELEQEFFVDRAMILDAISHHSMFNMLHNSSIFKVDVFIPRKSPAEDMRFQRRVRQIVKEDPVQLADIISAEDLILSKLEWYELGHRVSDHQWIDVLWVIQVQANRLDRDYLRHWAAELGVSDLLERAYQEAGPPSTEMR